ncbi:MAG: glycosyltransferase family 2 protein [Planctomycetota bacterium]
MKFSIVTPSLNQGPFIDRTIRSVLDQRGDFDLEYIVIDGGSTDGTLDILRRYAGRLAWTSGPDAGQSDAVNKGFKTAAGDVLAWLNSDDAYLPGALAAVAAEYARAPFAWCFGHAKIVDDGGREIRHPVTRFKVSQARRYSYRRLVRRNFISQPAAFFSREAWNETGGLDPSLHYAMDYDLWLRLGRLSDPRWIDRFLADFRWHGASKLGMGFSRAAREALEVAHRHAGTARRIDLLAHSLHCVALCALYRVLPSG